MLEPIYANTIIVGCIKEEKLTWYITEKDIWYMDFDRLERAYQLKGINFFIDENERFGLRIINKDTEEKFLKAIEEFVVAPQMLNSQIKQRIMNDINDDLLDFQPSLLLDFDKHILYSMFPEPASYEKYVSDEWVGVYEDFTKKINKRDQYWLDMNGKNLFIERGIE